LDGKWKSAAVRARIRSLARRAPYHSDEFLNVASIGGALADFSKQQKRAARAFFFNPRPHPRSPAPAAGGFVHQTPRPLALIAFFMRLQ
jgi:hypothetical protein